MGRSAVSPAALAALHAEAMTSPPPWSAEAIAALLADRHVHAHAQPVGFALGRTAGGESELLTLAVRPSARRLGHGAALLAAYEDRAMALGARAAFLEVAENNAAARALYASAGWDAVGRRRAYYGGTDALVLSKALT